MLFGEHGRVGIEHHIDDAGLLGVLDHVDELRIHQRLAEIVVLNGGKAVLDAFVNELAVEIEVEVFDLPELILVDHLGARAHRAF
jgi:hypothetical protein